MTIQIFTTECFFKNLAYCMCLWIYACCVYMCIWVGVKEHVNVCMQRTEVDIRYLSQSFSVFVQTFILFYFICVCIYTCVQVFLETRRGCQIDFRNPETSNTGSCELPAIGSLSNSGSLRTSESSFQPLHLLFELDIH